MTWRTLAMMLVIGASVSDSNLCGQEPATTGPRMLRHRVTGLFMKERVDDLRQLFEERIPEVRLVSVDFDQAEAVFEYDPDKVLNRPKPEQIVERLDSLVRTQSYSTFGIRGPLAKSREQLKRVEIPIRGLDCKGCCFGAYEAIYRLDGVEQATASFRDGLVVAWIDPDKMDQAKLEMALKQRNVTLGEAAAK